MHTFTPYEKDLINGGFRLIAGVDEAGRGPIAGPVVAAAVIFLPGIDIPGVNDSKSLKPTKREELADEIKSQALSWAVGVASTSEIDCWNILNAAHLAMKRAVSSLKPEPALCLVDGYPIPAWEQLHRGIIKGDCICFTIAAASIIAKVHRDEMMLELHRQYPQYGFDRHKGYPTKMHRRMIEIYGPSPVHRMTFKLLPDEKPS
ncbi:MAG: ribonuclease HII [candidate division Zixibacteria bacterium]|nr:ribonuclease HII [Candidatus Tariuqbacter arcticus]